MSQLQYFTALSALWIGLAWMPYVINRVLVRGLMGALANPSPDQAPQSPWAQRAKAAHAVSVEMFVAFAPLSVLAMITIPDDSFPGTLAMTFLIGMLFHYVTYSMGIIVLRTLGFSLASLSTAALGLRVLGWI